MMNNRYDGQKGKKPNFTRVNFQIRCPNVRVVRDGEQLGILPTDKARRMAQDAGLDLVEVAAHANPPVCHIVEYAKYRYEQAQKDKEARRKQRATATEIKEIRLRPSIQGHDVETKVKSVAKFVGEGKKVQLTLVFRNREITHKDEGFRVVNSIIEAVKDVAAVERPPKMEGNRLTCRLQPKEKREEE